MEAVQDVERVGAVLGDQLQVGFPHVRADELDLPGQFLADHGEEFLEALAGALLADPQQAHATSLDLVDQRQIGVSPPILDLVHTNGADRPQLPLLQPPLHDRLHGLADFLPTGMEALCRLLPRKLARPVRQIQHVGTRQGVFAHCPRHFLDPHPAGAAVHPPHAVQ